MRVYQVRGNSDYFADVGCDLSYDERRPFMLLASFGEELLPTWKILQCKKLYGSPLGDISWFSLMGNMPVVFDKIRLIDDIENHLATVGEFLPVDVEGTRAHAVNVRRLVNVCDYEKSNMYRTDNGAWLTTSPVFKRSALDFAGLFRIPEFFTTIYSAEPDDGKGFRAAYLRHNLVGLDFIEKEVSDA